MITIDQEKLQKLVEEYKTDFKENIPLELYKWEAVKHFQENWDIDAEDFPAMLSRSLSKTENLLASMSNFAKGMIVQFAERFPAEVKELFSILFDETLDLKERIESFTIGVKQIHAKWDGKDAKSHFQTPNAISTYLWLRFPDSYYIFKPTVAKRMFDKLCNDTVKTSEVDGIIKTYELYDSISEVLRKDEELKGMLSSALTNNCYPDLQMKTAIVDFAYFFSKSHIVKRHLLRKFLEYSHMRLFQQCLLSNTPISRKPPFVIG